MRFAIQSILWGAEMESLQQMLSEVVEAGFHGIELFQDFSKTKFGGPAGIAESFAQNDLRLVGVSSGSIRDKTEFVKAYCYELNIDRGANDAPYLYVDEWDDRCTEALADGFRIALHPHMFRPIQTMAEANEILDKFTAEDFPNLEFLPDTAHLTIAGERPDIVLAANFSRIRAIHVKDWDPSVGRSYQFFSSGFCSLGTGSVKINSTLDILWKRQFKGWVVVEQDYSANPRQSMKAAADWLRDALPPTVGL